jgi:hypothetical protein
MDAVVQVAGTLRECREPATARAPGIADIDLNLPEGCADWHNPPFSFMGHCNLMRGFG